MTHTPKVANTGQLMAVSQEYSSALSNSWWLRPDSHLVVVRIGPSDAIRVCRFTHMPNESQNNCSKDNEISGPIGDRSTWQIQKNHDNGELRLGNQLRERRCEFCQCKQDSHPWPSIYVQNWEGQPLPAGSRMNHNTERKKEDKNLKQCLETKSQM